MTSYSSVYSEYEDEEHAFFGKTSELKTGSDEWLKIIKNFLCQMPHARPGLKIGWVRKIKHSSKTQKKYKCNTLYHGTSYEKMLSIVDNGFDINKCERNPERGDKKCICLTKEPCKTCTYGDNIFVCKYRKVEPSQIHRYQPKPSKSKSNITSRNWAHAERAYFVNGAVLPIYIIHLENRGTRCDRKTRKFTNTEIQDIIDNC